MKFMFKFSNTSWFWTLIRFPYKFHKLSCTIWKILEHWEFLHFNFLKNKVDIFPSGNFYQFWRLGRRPVKFSIKIKSLKWRRIPWVETIRKLFNSLSFWPITISRLRCSIMNREKTWRSIPLNSFKKSFWWVFWFIA